MSKQFLDVPVENAKELIERLIANATLGLTDYAGATISYDSEIEVILTTVDLTSLSSGDASVIYFGTYVNASDSATSAVSFTITDGSHDYTMFNGASEVINAGSYDCIVMNKVANNASTDYFYGYKFNVTTA